MSLSEIQNKLYRKEEDKELTKYDQIDFDVRKSSINPQEAGFKKAGDVWEENKSDLTKEKNNALKIAGIAFAAIVTIVVLILGAYFFRKTSFSEDRVGIEISGSKEAFSGKEVAYEIIVNNNNRATLKNASLKINFPEGFIPSDNVGFKQEGSLGGSFDLGDVNGHEKRRVAFKGKVYSPKGTIIYLKTVLMFSPSGFSGQYSANNQAGINVVSSPLSVSLMAPQNISNGDSVDYLITFKNEGIENYDNVKIKMDYPAGFAFSKSDPNVSEGNNSWYIGNVSAGQSGKIIVSGKLEGMKDEIKYAKVYVGEMKDGQFVSQNEEKVVTKIEASLLSITQLVNDRNDLSVNAGDNLRFKISYKNEGSIGLRDVIITEKIDSDILDYGVMKFENKGALDMKNKTITWKASDVPELKTLKPGDGGTIMFEIKVKDIIPIKTAQDKNFIISSIAKIDSPDIPTPIQGNKIIGGNKMDIKLNSKLVLDVKGYYYDSFIKNSGPLPTKVGQETTYTINWKVMNISNDVSDVKVESALPSGVSMTGKIYPEGAKLTYNERTNSIVWEIGNLSAGTGILSAPQEVRFQVKIIPSPDQVDKLVSILSPSIITGKDLFSNQYLRVEAEGKDTYLIEDQNIKGSEYKVVQ